MDMTKTVVLLDPEMREKIRPILRRHGMTVSSFMRKQMADYIDAYEQAEKEKVERVAHPQPELKEA